MKNTYKFVVATPKDKEEFEKTPTAISLDKLNLLKNTSVIYNNKVGLSEVYNSYILDPKNANSFLIFLHDDILIEDAFLEEKLTAAFQLYDIVGLAGTKKCNLSNPTNAWHLMSDPKEFVGEVSHTKDKMFWTNSYGPTPSRALLIDGLFIGVNVARLLETSTNFDNEFSFHHYDIAFCLNANKNKLKLGVYPIKLVHFGLGDSMLSKEWQESNQHFINKYHINE